MKKWLGLVWLSWTCSGCVTAMGEQGIARLTTCPEATMEGVKSTLLRNGYQLRRETPTELVTEYRVTDEFGADRRTRQITVLQSDDGTIHFKERLRTLRVDDGLLMGPGPGRRSGLSVGVQVGGSAGFEQEFDQDYYEERRSDYEAVQRDVCG